jgi:hypothetical protein
MRVSPNKIFCQFASISQNLAKVKELPFPSLPYLGMQSIGAAHCSRRCISTRVSTALQTSVYTNRADMMLEWHNTFHTNKKNAPANRGVSDTS